MTSVPRCLFIGFGAVNQALAHLFLEKQGSALVCGIITRNHGAIAGRSGYVDIDSALKISSGCGDLAEALVVDNDGTFSRVSGVIEKDTVIELIKQSSPDVVGPTHPP